MRKISLKITKKYLNKLMKAENIFAIFILIIFLSIAGCAQDPEEHSKTKSVTGQMYSHTSSDAGVEHASAEAHIDGYLNKGSWHMDSTAKDYNFKDVTTFDDGSVRYSNGMGE